MTKLSDGSFSTFWRTYKLLNGLVAAGAITRAEALRVIASADRHSDGRPNVAGFARHVRAVAEVAREEHPELFLDPPSSRAG